MPEFVPLTIKGTAAVVHLQKGRVALIDVADWRLTTGRKWGAMRNGKVWYVQSIAIVGVKSVYLHRVLMGLGGPRVDHKNGDGLNNRRENLRHCTQSQNMGNSRRRIRNKSSGFRGVQPRVNKFRAFISVGGKQRYVGSYDTAAEAARAYDDAAKQAFGEFAILNFPVENGGIHKDKESMCANGRLTYEITSRG